MVLNLQCFFLRESPLGYILSFLYFHFLCVVLHLDFEINQSISIVEQLLEE